LSLVIDTSALMAFVQRERGADVALEAIPLATASAVIVAECLSKLAERGHDPAEIEVDLKRLGLRTADVDQGSIRTVVSLHHLRRKDVSLADRFCLALALDRGWPVVTADRPWALLGLPVELRFIR
jgi:PIN domain nuclease of toxin-antitoxin system